MEKGLVFLIVLSMIACSFGVVSGGNGGAPVRVAPSSSSIDALLGGYFTLNEGQVGDATVVLHSRNAFFTPTGVLFRLTEGEGGYVFKMSFQGANRVVPMGVARLPFDSNFFIGNDPLGWRTGVPNYREVVYEGLYDGADLVFKATPEGVKYEFIVHPGGNVDDIRLAFDGAQISTDGKDLFIETPLGLVKDGGLVVYQDPDVPLDARELVEDGTVGYKIDDRRYDPSGTLIIDPLIFSTLFGGGAGDSGESIALDSSNDMYVAGATNSANFPTTVGAYDRTANGNQDAFVLALNATGKDLIYATYVGGSNTDLAHAIAVDSSKNAYVTGETYSLNFPTIAGSYDLSFNGIDMDAFVFKLNPTGSSLTYSTYVGGNSDDAGNDIALDGSGNVYVAGKTWSTNFPTVSAYSAAYHGMGDIIVFKLNPAGSALVFSTYIGGSSWDYGDSLAIDPSNNVYVTGQTASSADYPTTNGAYDTTFNGGQFDLFVLRLNASGSPLDYSTFVGGSNFEFIGHIAVDASGNAYVTGMTVSNNFPTTPGAYDTTYGGGYESFLFKLNSTGKGLVYSTYVGNNGDDTGNDVALDKAGDAYVTGQTDSINFPTSPGAYCTTFNAGVGTDGFIFAVNSTGKGLIYSSFVGGTNSDTGNGIALDAAGLIYITGWTISANFPTTQGAFCTTLAAGGDGFVLKMKVPLPPGLPKGLVAASGNGYVLLDWARPDDDGGAKITNCRVYRGPDPGSLTPLMLIGNVTEYNDTTVTNGVKYYYAITAKNAVGEGPMSAIVSATPSTIPEPPQNLKAAIGNKYVNLTWAAPSSTGGAPITHYKVYKGLQQTSLAALPELGNISVYNDTTVQNGVTYYYAVSALNQRGEGPCSSTVKAIPGKVPSAPRNLSAAIGDAYVLLDWDGPQDLGGYALTIYKVYKEGAGSARAVIGQVATLGYNDTTVENGKTYNYSVSATNALGEGPAGPVVLARPGRVPGAPTLTAQAGDGRVDLSWTAGNDGGYPVSVFRVYRGTEATAKVFLVNATGMLYNDTTVENGKTYQYAVSAVNALGEGPMSSPVPAMPKGIPGRPVNLTAAAGNGFVVLSWLPPTDTGGLAVSGYKVYSGKKATGEDLALLKEGTTLTYNDSKVVNKATYYYAVSAVNEVGEGPRTVLVQATPLGLPGKVQDLLAKGGDGHVLLGWAAPGDDGGSPILGYKVFKGNPLLSVVSSLSLNDTAVKNGVNYTYFVAAYTAVGIGERSKVMATPGATPKAPTNLTAAKKGDGVLLRWSPPQDTGGFMVEEYRIYRGTSPDALSLVGKTSPLIDGATEGCSYLDKDVKAGKTYYYRVSAKNVRGEGTRSDVASQKVNAAGTGIGGTVYLLLAVLIAVIIAVVVAVLVLRKRKGRTPEAAPQVPPPQPQPMQYGYQQPQQQQEGLGGQGQAWEAGQQPPSVPPPQGP
jgi:fibronectin type 3 domain-containing protein